MQIFVVDAYNMVFRSFASLPSAITSENGSPINAVYGSLAYLTRLVREHRPDRIAAAFDVPDEPTFRHRLFPQYQAQRGPLGGENADDFARQVKIADDLLPHLGIPTLSVPGFEADDIIGTLALRLAREGAEVTAVSTDKDLLQLVRPGIRILVPGKENRLIADEDNVRERIGVAPAGVTTFKALAGDPSDNIPGLPGIGTKTAAALVNGHGDLARIYEHVDELPARQAAILQAGADLARLFQDIATIRTDVPGVTLEGIPPLAINEESRPRELLRAHGYG